MWLHFCYHLEHLVFSNSNSTPENKCPGSSCPIRSFLTDTRASLVLIFKFIRSNHKMQLNHTEAFISALIIGCFGIMQIRKLLAVTTWWKINPQLRVSSKIILLGNKTDLIFVFSCKNNIHSWHCPPLPSHSMHTRLWVFVICILSKDLANFLCEISLIQFSELSVIATKAEEDWKFLILSFPLVQSLCTCKALLLNCHWSAKI